MQRLDKFVAGQTALSRREVRQLVRKGLITVNGAPASAADCRIDEETDRVAVNGEEIAYQQYVYIMLHKPQGVLSASRDPKAKTVVDLVPEALWRKGLFPAGRLDKDTEGFVLLTDDGALAHRLLSPRSHVPKTYEAILERQPSDQDIEAFQNGLTLQDGTKCKPAGLRILEQGARPRVEVVLCEGMYHQIKRMFETLGNRVIYLKRTAMGGVLLDENLGLGQCRAMLHKEVEKLLEQKPE